MGYETSLRARAEGAEVIIAGRDPGRLQSAAKEPGARDSAVVDATDPAAVGQALSAVGTAALPALVANLALEIAPVRINLIAAGFVDTPLSASLLGDGLERRRQQLRDTLPIRRVVGPADVAALAVHIMINTALTGATYDIDGGQQLLGG
jgi:NAD(P)-dependent dehydrogenase (short-subunit alcohol dehydrogenase family)